MFGELKVNILIFFKYRITVEALPAEEYQGRRPEGGADGRGTVADGRGTAADGRGRRGRPRDGGARWRRRSSGTGRRRRSTARGGGGAAGGAAGGGRRRVEADGFGQPDGVDWNLGALRSLAK